MEKSSLIGLKYSLSEAPAWPPTTTSTMTAISAMAYMSFAGERKTPFIWFLKRVKSR